MRSVDNSENPLEGGSWCYRFTAAITQLESHSTTACSATEHLNYGSIVAALRQLKHVFSCINSALIGAGRVACGVSSRAPAQGDDIRKSSNHPPNLNAIKSS